MGFFCFGFVIDAICGELIGESRWKLAGEADRIIFNKVPIKKLEKLTALKLRSGGRHLWSGRCATAAPVGVTIDAICGELIDESRWKLAGEADRIIFNKVPIKKLEKLAALRLGRSWRHLWSGRKMGYGRLHLIYKCVLFLKCIFWSGSWEETIHQCEHHSVKIIY